jgi:anti-sigma regulatory factor (Ser/Thr protein kinase)
MHLHEGSSPAALGRPPRPPHSFREYRALHRSVPEARHHAHSVITTWGLPELADTAELLVSELVTNAVCASVISGHAIVRLLLTTDADGVRISVWDGAPGRPMRKESLTADAEGGRGLVLVEMLSADYGSYMSAGHGKVVWCVVGNVAQPAW